ncbi:hypothetical protein E2C01_017944 [Portunus trituberculatus]|uniref:Uncharacterized protein n=1 Tax=Portunus trituberculatus TaxID=210409 RepID=A0A5B7DTT1_PORTR|nr:hypothetical protein [Portunus trituberculatus]
MSVPALFWFHVVAVVLFPAGVRTFDQSHLLNQVEWLSNILQKYTDLVTSKNIS